MIATPHVSASLAGWDVLRRGGNAVDAAIAANAVLAVVYPASCGLGGDLFALIYEPADGRLHAYNGSGRAPAALHAGALRERGMRTMPIRGPLTVTVPGAIAGWETLARNHGTFDLDALLEPAERTARDGFAITDVVAKYAALNADLLASPQAAGLFSARTALPGAISRNPDLAATIASVRREGARVFYEGAPAASIVRTLQGLGSPMTQADLAAHVTEEAQALRIPWNGFEACAHPPNSQAILGPMVLSMLERDGGRSQTDWTHTAIEAFKFAFDARDARFGEPSRMAPIDDLLDPVSLRRLRERIDPLRARVRAAAAAGGGTIGIVAADAPGRCVSLIQSLYMNFGSGIVAGGTGVFLQNRGAYFSLEPGHPNELVGGTRPVHTLSPGMLLRNGKPALIYATMGGDGQTQTHVQIAHNIFERGLDVQSAIDAPRFVYGRDSESAFADAVKIESRAEPELIQTLRERGHHVDVLGPFESTLGHAHAIVIDQASGTFSGGSDPRADSAALPL